MPMMYIIYAQDDDGSGRHASITKNTAQIRDWLVTFKRHSGSIARRRSFTTLTSAQAAARVWCKMGALPR